LSLVVDRVEKRFGPVLALDGLSFVVPEGEVFGFVGANGAGKTTTMRIALGVVRPDAGRITWRGRGSEELPRKTWGYLPEERGLYHRMAVLDQLVYFGQLYGLSRERAIREARSWLARFRIADLARRRTEELSKGNQQKVQLIAAVLHGPEVLLMDEPFTGLDPVNVTILREAFLDLRREGKTIVFSTHQMEAVETLCESVAIIDRGRRVVGGPLREVKRSTGRLAVRIGFETATDTAWLGDLPGARVVRRGTDEAEVALDPATEPDSVLTAALGRGLRIRRFEVLEPSLEQIFLERVGRPSDDAAAADPSAAGTAHGSVGRKPAPDAGWPAPEPPESVAAERPAGTVG
jgi:ABC-2 type transport system ATP-binding protein